MEHQKVTMVILFELCNRYDFQTAEKWYKHRSVIEDILWLKITVGSLVTGTLGVVSKSSEKILKDLEKELFLEMDLLSLI